MKQNLFYMPSLAPLYREGKLHTFTAGIGHDILLGESIRRWSARKISHIFLIQTPENRDDIARFRLLLRNEPFTLVVLPDSIVGSNFSYVSEINEFIHSILRKSPALVLHTEKQNDTVQIVLKRLQLYIKRTAPAPDEPAIFQEYGNYLAQIKAPPSGNGNGNGNGNEKAEQTQQPPAPAVEKKGKPQEKKESDTPETALAPAKPKEVEKKPLNIKQTENITPFRPSRLTIKIKMMTIISLIILAALSLMIFLASKYFRQESELRIQENNLNLTEIIGQKIELDLNSFSQNVKIFAAAILEENITKKRAKQISEIFFKDNKNFIFVGIAENQNGVPVYSQSFYNDDFLILNKIARPDIDAMIAQNTQYFMKAFSGGMVAHNASPGMKQAVMGIGVPYGNRAVIAFLNPVDFLKTFKTSGIVTTFMVNEVGEVIAHPNGEMVLSRTNLSTLPIIQEMMKSPIDNGQKRFEDTNKVTYYGSFKKIPVAGLGIISTVKEEKAFEEVNHIQERNLIITGIILVIALLIVFFYARSLTIPIIRLVQSTKEVEEGNYEINISPASRDEVGVLTNSFLRMSYGLAEREKMKDAFGRFVNKEIAEKVLSGDLSLGGEKKDAAIFFSDLRGFTAMSEGMLPEEVVEFLNQYFTRMVACVNNTKGIVDKFIGDAIMAHWGALASYGNDTENAVNAAIAMRKALIEFNRDADGTTRPLARFGCGINTGPVIAGQIGSEERLEFTVIGDAVNLASRIEALNKPFKTDILISTDSYELVRDIFRVEKMPAIKVKGKVEPQTIYAVLGRFDDPQCPESMEEVRKMVGIEIGPGHTMTQDVMNEDEAEVKYEILDG